MPFLTWLPAVLRAAGLDVYEMPGSATRTTRASGLTELGQVFHHTATSIRWQDGHVAALLRDGRRDLSGPLSQMGVERDGTIVIVALGRCNHNGYGTWGNDSIGWEVYNDGVGEAFPMPQMMAVRVGMAAVCRHKGWDPYTTVKAHRETDPSRKIDPTGVDMNAFRNSVAALASHPTPQEPDDMTPEQTSQLLADVAAIKAEQLKQNERLDELRRNVRRDMQADGVPDAEIER